MRLTLRTLLAWMDGVLPDDQRAALGEKVEASQLARQLIDRIEGAVANDRIDAPRVAGKGLVADANTVAEYLDNALATERLEAFETICLESDLHLAEVAGCHRMLAEVARDPTLLAPLDEARRRALLESIEHRLQGQPDILLAGAAAPQGASDRSPARGQSRGGGVAMRPVAPEPTIAVRRRTPAAVWALLGSSLVVILALGAVFLRSAGLLGGGAPRDRLAERRDAPPAGDAPAPVAAEGGAVAAVEPAAAPAPALDDLAAVPAPADADAGDAGAPRRGLADLLAQADAADAAAADAGAGADVPGGAAGPADAAMADAAPAEPADAAAAAGPPAPRGPTKVPSGEALAIAAGARPTRPPRAAAPPAGAADATAGPDVAGAVGLDALPAGKGIGFLAADGVVLVRVAAGDIVTWHPLAVDGQVTDGAEIVVPPGMRPEINLGGISVRCQPGSILRLSLAADGTPRVEVTLGRVVCRAARDDGRISLRARGLDGVVVRGLEGGVAVEVAAGGRPGDGDARRTASARIVAIREALEWKDAGQGEGATAVPAGADLRDPPAAAGAVDAADGPPAWIVGADRGETLERGAAATFIRRLAELPEGSAPAAGMAEVLEAMAIDRRVENRVFAATTLALSGNYDVAADLLCAEAAGRRLEGRQWAALEAAVVPMALARGEASAERLRRAWEDRGPPGRATLLDLMARRPTDGELESGADRAIVEALGDGALVVRRSAFACLDAIVRPAPADRARYRPDASEEARRDGAAWWRTQQERGLVRRAP
ncbi:MAG: hypothetical protein ACKO5R_13525 [Planctomycetaceae bacterium]